MDAHRNRAGAALLSESYDSRRAGLTVRSVIPIWSNLISRDRLGNPPVETRAAAPSSGLSDGYSLLTGAIRSGLPGHREWRRCRRAAKAGEFSRRMRRGTTRRCWPALWSFRTTPSSPRGWMEGFCRGTGERSASSAIAPPRCWVSRFCGWFRTNCMGMRSISSPSCAPDNRFTILRRSVCTGAGAGLRFR